MGLQRVGENLETEQQQLYIMTVISSQQGNGRGRNTSLSPHLHSHNYIIMLIYHCAEFYPSNKLKKRKGLRNIDLNESAVTLVLCEVKITCQFKNLGCMTFFFIDKLFANIKIKNK